jgi:hypothetical protein
VTFRLSGDFGIAFLIIAAYENTPQFSCSGSSFSEPKERRDARREMSLYQCAPTGKRIARLAVEAFYKPI